MSRSPTVYTDLQGLGQIKTQARRDPDKALHQVASQFESLFIQNMLKGARAASLAPGALDGPHSDTYREMYEQQLAQELSKGKGIGIADMLVRQLRNAQEMTNPKENPYVQARPPGAATSVPSVSSKTTVSKTNSPPIPVPATSNVVPSTNRPNTPQEFVDQIWPAASKAAAELGVDPAVLVAQAALESGWGRSTPQRSDGTNSYNLFGIKADSRWQGDRTVVSTLEYEDGVAVRRRDPFRVYGSFDESFADYARFIRSNPRYQEALSHGANPQAFLSGLQQAGYATDPAYARKVTAVMQGSTFQEVTEGYRGT